MTTTLQQPVANPQMKRLVYSKYREMLGSYNGKANTIIQALPEYLVHEDKGFNITSLVENPRDCYGAPPPPPPPIMGGLPTTRLQTQLPPEAPACVQNAMMTKDKKPFTYTPGGIDLSQIKSPRMAKRISRNACSEGVTGVPKVSPLAQPNVGVQPPTPPVLPSGMPVQVFPCGPPQPPPPPQAKLSTQNGINGNKSPERKSPQSFEPPPFGCRPEIKIPPNPMANLRPTPKPQPKDDFWVEEYRKERSISPMAPQPSVAQSPPRQVNVDQVDRAPITRAEVQKPQISQKPSSPVTVVPKRPSPVRSASPPRPQIQPPSPVKTPQQETPLTVYNNVAQKESSPVRIVVKQNHRAPSPVRQEAPQSPPQRNVQLGSLYIPPVEDQMANRQHLINQQTPPWMQARNIIQKEMPEWVNRDEPKQQLQQQMAAQQNQINMQQQQHQMNLQQQHQMNYQPQLNQTSSNPRERIIPIQLEQTPTPTKTPVTPGFGPQPFYNVAQQYNNVQSPTAYSPPVYNNPNQFVDQGYNNYGVQQQNAGQRIIPISIDGQSPENSFNVRGPVSQQPTVIRSDPRSPPTQTPPPQWAVPNQSKSFRILQKMTDTIADGQTSEEDTGPAELQQPHYSRPLGPADMNENQLRKLQLTDNDRILMNRVKNQVDQETYLHSEEDPRYRGAAIPSKAFKLLQNMTDGGQAYDNQVPVQRANPRFAQQRAVFQPNQGENQVYVHPSEQQVPEPKIYTGSAIPSRSFKMLQAMTTPENAAESTDASDIDEPSYTPIPYPPPYPYYYDPHWQYYAPSPMTVPPEGYWGGFYGPPGYNPYYPYYGYAPYYPPPFIPISDDESQSRRASSLRRSPSIVVTPAPDEQDMWTEDLKKNLSGSDKRYSGDDEKMANEDSDDSDSSTSSSTTEKHEQLQQSPSKSGLQTIKSVTDINVYADESEEEEEENEESDHEDLPEMNDEIIPHQLSVIYEESERSKRRPSHDDTESGSTFSDSDTTIACEDEEVQCDESNMVTVRLPLKISYSRSSNDEEITTVHVGNSETRNSSDADVSVTVSIPSRASSIDRGGLSKTPSAERRNSSGFEFDESDSEVSVSISLPMKRDKFFEETQTKGTCNDISQQAAEEVEEDEESEYEYVTDSEDEKSPVPIKKNAPEETECEDVTEYEEVTETEVEDNSKDQAVTKIKTNQIEEKKIETKEDDESSDEDSTEYEIEYVSESEDEIVRRIRYVRERIIYRDFVHPKSLAVEIVYPEEPQNGRMSYIKEEIPEVATTSEEAPDQISYIEHKVEDSDEDSEEDDDDEENEESESEEEDEEIKVKTNEPETIPIELLPKADEEEVKVCVKDRIAVFESVAASLPPPRDIRRLANVSHRSSVEESADDDDSGVTSDISRPISDTESENFPELRKMSRYERAATHSRLFKLLQDECAEPDEDVKEEEKVAQKAYKTKKIVHNVSITRRTNPNAVTEAETMEERRKRLSLPLEKSSSTDQESMSSSSTSPTGVNEKLVSELVQSLLMQKRGRMLRNVPIEKLHAAAKRVLLEDADLDSVLGSSQEDTTVDSTPALTPQELTYSDYYDSWNDTEERFDYDIIPSRAFRCLQEQSATGQRKSWAARCPRVLSSKTINRDLSRVTEIRESESPEVTPPNSSARSTPHLPSPDLKSRRSPMSEDTGVHKEEAL